MDLKQGKVAGERYKLKYKKNKPVFSIKNLYTMSGSDYSKPSLENVKAGIDYDNYYGLYATDKPYDENDIDKGTNVYTQTFFNDKADGKEKILDMQKELTKEERANIADGLQKHIENKLGYLLEPALNIEEGTAWANDVAKHKKAKKLMDKLNEIRNGDFTSGGSIYHSIRNILSDFKPEAQKYNSNYTHKMARDFLLSIGYDVIIDDWKEKRRQIVSFRDDNITVDRHQKAVDYGKLEDVNELTDEEPKLSVEPLDKENRSNTSETALTKLKSPLEISDKDFLHPTRSIELPSLPQETLDLIGAEQKPILLKRNILEKNLANHKELTPKLNRDVLNKALYHSDLIGQSKAKTKPTYWVAVKLGNKNAVVVLDLTETKTHHEIVGWRLIDKNGFERMKRQAHKEGGQFLITESENAQGAAALSALQMGSALNINNQIQKVNKKSAGPGQTHYKYLAEKRFY